MINDINADIYVVGVDMINDNKADIILLSVDVILITKSI